MRIILLGAPGAGKGTQASLLCETFNLPKISTGDMLRAEISAGSSIGLSVQQMIANGQLVPDDLIFDLLKNRLNQPDCRNGFLLDGFPRNVLQAQALAAVFKEKGIEIDHVIYIRVQDEDIIKRISGRRIHLASGRTYHTVFNPPEVDNKDDVTGELLIQREDDTEAAIRNRLRIYHQETEPVIEWYKASMSPKQFSEIPGVGTVESIQKDIYRVLKFPEQ